MSARWQTQDEPVFNKTVVPVRLAQYGNDQLISRSQAKRVLARIDLFSTVLLDFEGVPAIGRAFADEVFGCSGGNTRTWASSPSTTTPR